MKRIFSSFLVAVILFNMMTPMVVYADEPSEPSYTFEGVTNKKFSVNLDETKELKIISTQGYRITNCTNNYTINNIITATYDDNTCMIKGNRYGIVPINVSLSDLSGTNITEHVYVDVQSEDYFDTVVSNIPSTIYTTMNNVNRYSFEWLPQLPSEIQASRSGICIPQGNKYSCPIEFSYYYASMPGEQNTSYRKTKTIEFITTGIYFSGFYSAIKVGDNAQIGVKYEGPQKDLVYVSHNNSVAKVDNTGEVTGVGPGTTSIGIFSTSTREYKTYPIKVIANVPPLDAFVTTYSNKEIEVDASEYYSTGYYGNYGKIYALTNFLSERYFETYGQSISSLQVNCDDSNICSATYTDWDNGVNQVRTLSNMTLKLTGIKFKNLFSNPKVGAAMHFEVENFLPGTDTLTFVEDPEYLELQEDGTYKFLKAGKTTLIVNSQSGYHTELSINIEESESESTILENYIKSLSTIALPYSDANFSANQLSYLENIISKKIINNYPTESLRNVLKTKVTCLTNTYCLFTLQLYGAATPATNKTSINYLKTDATTIANFDSVYSKITDKILTNAQTFTQDKNCNGDLTCMLDSTTFKEYITNGIDLKGITVDITYKDNEKVNDKTLINSIYNIVFKSGDIYLGEKVVNLKPNYLFNLPTTVVTEEEIINYIKTTLQTTYDIDGTVVKDDANTYKVTYGSRTIYVMTDEYERISAISVSTPDGVLILDSGDTQKLSTYVYPSFANDYTILFESLNPEIATVSDDGVITAVSEGLAKIKLSLDGQSSYSIVIVLVDKTLEEYFNETLNKLPNSVEVDYGSILNMGLIQSLQSQYYLEMNKINSGVWAFMCQITKEDDKYYLAIQAYINGLLQTSDKKEITYVAKGIKISDRDYDVAVNEEVDTGLLFTEGSIDNLIIEIEDSKVASFDKTGKIKGLKPGITSVSIRDKYYKYYNYFNIRVDFNSFYEDVIDELKESPLEIRSNQIPYYNQSNIEEAFRNTITDKASYQVLNKGSNSGEVACDLDEMKCTYTIRDYGNDGQVIDSNDFDIAIKGIVPKTKESEVAINSTIDIDYESYPSGLEVSLTSLNPTVCSIVNNQVKGLSTGVCMIKLSSGSDYNYHAVLVNKTNIKTIHADILDDLGDTITIKSKKISEIEEEDYEGQELVYIAIEDAIKDLIEKNPDYEVTFDILDDDNITLFVNESYAYTDGNGYRYDGLHEEIAQKTFTAIYETASYSEIDAATEILEKIKDSYDLTLDQYMKFMSDEKAEIDNQGELISYGSFFIYDDKLPEYSDLQKLFLDYPEYSYSFSARMGSGYQINRIAGGFVVVYHNGKQVGSVQSRFTGRVNIELDRAVTEEELLQIIKTKVAESYSKVTEAPINNSFAIAKQNDSFVPNINTSIPVNKTVGNPQVNISKKFDSEVGATVYTINVEDLTFTTTLGVKSTAEATYGDTIKTGDINNDGLVNMVDLIKLRKHLAGVESISGSALTAADINKDGSVNITDLIKVRKFLAGLEEI